MYWHHMPNGVSIVNCTYKVQRKWKEEVVNQMGQSSSENSNSIWKKLWKINVTGKIKIFVWRFLHDILPRTNLVKRGVHCNLTCPFCEQEAKTLFHSLWSCPHAQEFWRATDMHSELNPGAASSCLSWFEEMSSRLNGRALKKFLILC